MIAVAQSFLVRLQRADARIAPLVWGAVAQLGERRVRNAKVEGSIPFRSTSRPASHLHNNWLDAVSARKGVAADCRFQSA
jgi:hypothetical protein